MFRVAVAVMLTALCAGLVVADGPDPGTVALRLKSARYLARGDTGLASANDGGTIAYNPANLAATSIAHYDDPSLAAQDPKPWKTECANSAGLGGDLDFWSLLRAFRNVHKSWGFGLGYASVSPQDRTEWWTAGFGTQLGRSNWNGGVALQHLGGGLLAEKAKNLINVGVQGNYSLPDGVTLQVAGLVQDITGRLDNGPLYSLGLAATFQNTLVEVNWWDLSDEIDSRVNLGVQQRLGDRWSLYAGLIDGDDLTAGVGYIDGWWNLAVGWMQSPRDTNLGSELMLTAGRRIRF